MSSMSNCILFDMKTCTVMFHFHFLACGGNLFAKHSEREVWEEER